MELAEHLFLVVVVMQRSRVSSRSCTPRLGVLVKEMRRGLVNESYQWLLLSVCGSLDCSKEHGSMQIKALKTQTGFCQLLEHSPHELR